ncbi:MAG: hypothetical protein JWN40_1375 [Phycisphaerales bacterium]|nr:hypothetical protein [Phycisphaerales bacterium]
MVKKNWLGVVAVLGLVAGCANNPPPYREGRAERYAPPQVQISGLNAEDLKQSTAIDRPSTYRDAASLLFVTVPLRNTGDQVLHVQYRYNFVDEQGRPLPENIAWNRKSLEPGATERITFNSTSPRAADFQMDLRYSR